MLRQISAQDNGKTLLQELAADELVSSLLLLHDLHPLSLQERVATGMEKLRPYLQSHGGELELMSLADGTLNVRLKGACGRCGGMRNSLMLMIERMILDAAPDLAGVNIQTDEEPSMRESGHGQPAA